MSDAIETRLQSVETTVALIQRDVGYIQKSTVERADMARVLNEWRDEQITPIREEQSKQATAITQLAKDMSTMVQANETTNTTLNGVLKTYNDNLIATAKAETERARQFGVANVLKIAVIIAGGFTAICAALVTFYAIARWVISNIP